MKTILWAAFVFLLALIPTALQAQRPKEIDWRPPLAGGGAPGCPDHVGSRTLRSETVSDGTTKALITGTTVRAQNKTCHSRADLAIFGRMPRTLPLPNGPERELTIIDFSPDGQKLLLESHGISGPLYENYRNESIAAIGLSQSEVRWVNVWDLFRWGHCEATVEPQGFTGDGRVVLLARPSNLNPPSKNDCVHDWGLYATDFEGSPVRLSDSTKVPRFGKAVTQQVLACKSDPDIVGDCFITHGRLSLWNGAPSARIWRVGTNRILGDHDDWPLPSDLAKHLDWDIEAWGDFEVCPFTKERPGVMQMVCVESASHVTFRSR